MKNRKYTEKELLILDPVEVYKLRLAGIIIRFPKGFFKEGDIVNYDVCAEITKYLIKEVLMWDDEEIKKKFNTKILKKYYLHGMLNIVFLGSPYEVIENAYPGHFKSWELSMAPNNYWNIETAKEATIWLIEEKLKWNDEEIKENLQVKTFNEFNLDSMLNHIFSSSPYSAIENAYPGRFKAWELKEVPTNYWNLETAKGATIWLVEEKLKWTDEDIINNLTAKIFHKNGLRSMLIKLFNYSLYDAINNAYPGRFKAWELKEVSTNYWNLETAKEATIWLIEEKLKWNDEDIINNLTVKIFHKNGLGGMLVKLFNNSPFKALDNAYPDKFKKISKRKIIKA